MSQLQMLNAGYIYNYEHVITQQLISAMESLILAHSLSPRIVPMSCLCPLDAAAFLRRVAYRYWPMIHRRCMLCRESL